MSIYTGKEIALYSEFHMFGDEDKTIEEQLKTTKIYLKDELLEIKTEHDLVPYYGNMCGIVCGTKEDGVFKKCLHITSVPYFLSQDWEWTERVYKDIQTIWRRCKRKNIPFTLNYVKEHLWHDDEPCVESMFSEIKKHPYAKLVRGKYHSTWMQRYRDKLVETMREFNYTEDQINEWVWNGRRTW